MKSNGIITYLLLAAVSLFLITLDLTDRVGALKDFLRYVLYPSPQIAARAISETKKLGGNISNVLRVSEENKELKKKIEQLKYFEAQYRYLSGENNDLRKMMGIIEKKQNKMIPAQVISRNPSRWYNTLIIDRGSKDGIKPDMPVIAVSGNAIGLAGRTIETGGNFSKVLLISDSLSYVPAKILRNGEMCVASGRERQELLLDYISPGCDIRLGDIVVTSGIGEVFPPGIPIGTVSGQVSQGKTYFFQVPVKPEVESGKIAKVLVITE